jgi:hypothetical protein
MIFLRTFGQRTARRRALLLGVLAATISALLVAPPASAETETVGAMSAPPTSEIPVVAEQPEMSATAAAPEPSAPEPVAAPVEAQEVASAVPAPDLAGEDSPVAPTSSESPAANPPVSTTAVDSVVDRVAPKSTGIVDSVATGAASAGTPARVEPDARAVADSRGRLSGLVQGIRRDRVSTAARATDQLSAALTNPALRPDDLLNSIAPTADQIAAPTGLQPGREESSAKGTMSFPPLARVGLFEIQGAIASAPSTELYAMEASEFEGGKIPALMPRHGEQAISAGTALPSPFLAHRSADRPGSPAPSDVPLPAPESPATAVPDSGGTSFVPIVALLALLALAASAAMRRFGKAADFRAPTSFVCALERPG